MQFAQKTLIQAALFLCCAPTFSLNAAPAATKPAEVEVIDISLQRKAGLIEVDTTVKNVSPKAINGLTAVYHFFAVRHVPVTTQRCQIDEQSIAPGEESTIRAKLEEPARAITVEFSAVDSNGHELRVKNAGPFSIE